MENGKTKVIKGNQNKSNQNVTLKNFFLERSKKIKSYSKVDDEKELQQNRKKQKEQLKWNETLNTWDMQLKKEKKSL